MTEPTDPDEGHEPTEPAEPAGAIGPAEPPGSNESEGDEATPTPSPTTQGVGRPSVWAALAWVVYAAGAVALDGTVGGLAAVAVAAVVLADLPNRWLGAAGVVAVAAVPIVVLFDGVPTDAEVSPSFVSRSMIPQHLMFVGLAWVGASAVRSVLPGLRRHRDDPEQPVPQADGSAELPAPVEPLGRLGTAARVVLVAVVLVSALAASAAVLAA